MYTNCFPGTYLASFAEHRDYINYPGGIRKGTATFKRDYVDPPVVTPPVWPAPPYPAPRMLPDPTLFLTQPFSRNAAGPISAATGAARPTTVSGDAAWRLIPAAKNAIRNPVYSGVTNWTTANGAAISANGDGSVRYQAAQMFADMTNSAGTALPAVSGETVTISMQAKSRTTTTTLRFQLYAQFANDYSGNTTDLTPQDKTITTSWQTFSVTKLLADAATQYVFWRLTAFDAAARDVDIRQPMLFKGGTVPEFVPALDGLGVLLPGDVWDGTPNASTSTRTAGSVGGALATFGSLYLRFSTDGTTVSNVVLTAAGTFGSGAGTVAHSGGNLAITSGSQVWVLAAIMYPSLSGPQKTYLDSVPTSSLTWFM